MKLSLSRDATLSTVPIIALAATVIIGRDHLYIGLWYYLVIPLTLLGSCALGKPPRFFLLGASLGIVVTYLVFFYWASIVSDGLLGLFHIFSLPGAYIGAWNAVTKAKRWAPDEPVKAAFIGFLGVVLGFFVCLILLYAGLIGI